ncbi:MAG: class I SAM-dependent methyltransferase [Sphingomonadales bacterium]
MPNESRDLRDRIATRCVCCGSEKLVKSPAILMPFVAHRVFGWAPVEIDDSWGLRTIRNGHAYSICNSVGCLDCGMLFLDIRFTDAEMGALYRGYREEEYTALREHYEPGYRVRNEELNQGIAYVPEVEGFLSDFLPERIRVLDWGGDTGMNTPFKDRADVFHIHDISARAAVAGATIIGPEAMRRTTYDLIVCSNVLEHVSFPLDLIEDIKSCMDRDSVLYIEVPFEEVVRQNDDVKERCAHKRHWHEHINFFCARSLGVMIRSAGLDILALKDLSSGADTLPHQFMVACRLRT